ncbi:MAG: O-antigen ligase family protein [Rhodospirillales bacterium]|nr:O-antigen ligase family protein [Rhodospirillales bacterium]
MPPGNVSAFAPAKSETAGGRREGRVKRRNRPLLAQPSAQIAVAVAACAVVGAVWQAVGKPLGGFVAFVLFFVPLCTVPFELCLAFVVLSHFRIPEVFPALYSFHMPELAAVSALAALVWHLWGTKRIRPYWSVELSLFALFFAELTLGVAVATSRETAFAFWSSYFIKVAIITLAIAWLSAGPQQFARAAHAFVAAGLAVSGVTLWNKVNGIGLVEGTRVTIGRDIGSVLGDPNDLSLVLLFPVSFALGLAMTRRIPMLSRLFGAVSVVILMLAILATQSRGGILGVLAVVAPFIQQKVKSLAVTATLGAVVAVGLYVGAGIGERTVLVGSQDGLDESAMGRVEAWQTAVNMALAHPITGVGMMTFVDNYFDYTDEWHGRAVAAHSVWFQVLAEAGFIGFFTFVAMIGATAGKLLRATRRLEAADGDAYARATAMSLLAGIAGFVVSGTFLSQAYTWPIYILLALSVSISRYAFAGAEGGPATAVAPGTIMRDSAGHGNRPKDSEARDG